MNVPPIARETMPSMHISPPRRSAMSAKTHRTTVKTHMAAVTAAANLKAFADGNPVNVVN